MLSLSFRRQRKVCIRDSCLRRCTRHCVDSRHCVKALRQSVMHQSVASKRCASSVASKRRVKALRQSVASKRHVKVSRQSVASLRCSKHLRIAQSIALLKALRCSKHCIAQSIALLKTWHCSKHCIAQSIALLKALHCVA